MSDLVLPRTRSLLLVAFVIAAFSSYLAVQVERDSSLYKLLFDFWTLLHQLSFFADTLTLHMCHASLESNVQLHIEAHFVGRLLK